MRRPIWDALDVAVLFESALDGFALEFYGCSWDQMKDKDARRVLNAFYSHLRELKEAA